MRYFRSGWFALQIAVMALFGWIDWEVTHSGDPKARAGFIFVFGIFVAFVLTAFMARTIDWLKTQSFIFGRSIRRPPAFSDDVANPIEHTEELSAVRRDGGELPKPLSAIGRGQ